MKTKDGAVLVKKKPSKFKKKDQSKLDAMIDERLRREKADREHMEVYGSPPKDKDFEWGDPSNRTERQLKWLRSDFREYYKDMMLSNDRAISRANNVVWTSIFMGVVLLFWAFTFTGASDLLRLTAFVGALALYGIVLAIYILVLRSGSIPSFCMGEIYSLKQRAEAGSISSCNFCDDVTAKNKRLWVITYIWLSLPAILFGGYIFLV